MAVAAKFHAKHRHRRGKAEVGIGIGEGTDFTAQHVLLQLADVAFGMLVAQFYGKPFIRMGIGRRSGRRLGALG